MVSVSMGRVFEWVILDYFLWSRLLRTGSKLGITPLMLASMNGHTQAVKRCCWTMERISMHRWVWSGVVEGRVVVDSFT